MAKAKKPTAEKTAPQSKRGQKESSTNVAQSNGSEPDENANVNKVTDTIRTVKSTVNGDKPNVNGIPKTLEAGNSRKNDAAEAVNVEHKLGNAAVEKGEVPSLPKSKIRGRPKKEKTEASKVTNSEQKLAVDPETEKPAPVKPNPKTTGSKSSEAMEVDVTEEAKPTLLEPSTSSIKSRKRKAEANPKSAKETKKNTVIKSKAKKQKVVLDIPTLRRISGKVFVIGENDVGQLGFDFEDVDVKKRPVLLELPQSVVDVAAGGMHSVCLTESGEVLTFGCNDEGALGRITTEEGSEWPPRKVEIPEKIIQISTGDSHTAALSESGQVYVWGNFRSLAGPMGLTVDGAKRPKPIKVLNDVTIVKISSGTEHLVCLSKEGVVYTMGCGENGQLGRLPERACGDGGRKGIAALLEPAMVDVHIRSKSVPIEDIFAGAYTTFLKAQDTGLIYAFGLNNYNHLGYENERVRFLPKQVSSFNDKAWLQITGGQHHTLALDSNGVVYSIGRKEYGRLGLGEDCSETSSPTVIPTLENEKCSYISCGNCVSFSLTEDGSVWSWGMGTNHQLGHGNDEDCFIPKQVEGNFISNWKAHKISGGGQHTLILASPKESSKSDKKK